MDTLKVTETESGWQLSGTPGLGLHDALTISGKLWLSLKVYKTEYEYDTGYVCFTPGAAPRMIAEDQGLMPVLFEGIDSAACACVTNPYGQRDEELMRQIDGAYLGKPFRPFVGDVLGLDGTHLLMTKTGRTDTMLRYDLTKGKRKLTKLESISSASYTLQNNRIHALTPRGRHIEFDTSGRPLRERTIDVGAVLHPVDISFDGPSALCGYHDANLSLWHVTPDGGVSETEILSGIEIYSLYSATPIDSATAAFRFVHDSGNGFTVIRNGRPLLTALSAPDGYMTPEGKHLFALPNGDHVLTALARIGDDLAVMTYDKSAPIKARDLHISRLALG